MCVCACGRGMMSENAVSVGSLVVLEWKFDGGTIVPPFLGQFSQNMSSVLFVIPSNFITSSTAAL